MKKRLLNEETTRRFMKLANLAPLNENYFEESINEEEVQEEGVGMYQEDDVLPEPPEPMPDEEEAGLDAEPEPEAGGCSDDVVSLIDAIAGAVEQATGCQMTVASDPAAEELPVDDAPLEDEEPVMEADEALEEEETVTEETVTEDDGIEEALNEANVQLASDKEEWLIKETLRRVTKRLVEASKK